MTTLQQARAPSADEGGGQRPHLFGKTRDAPKRTLDPAGIMNPGVLVP